MGGVGIKKLMVIVSSAIADLILVSMNPKWVKKWQDDSIEEIVDEELEDEDN